MAVTNENFDSITAKCASLRSEMKIRQQYPAPLIEFSNTGRRGTKYFTLPLRALLQTLKDMKQNFDVFDRIKRYEETPWRNAFSTYLTDQATNALSTVQTLPLFTVIAKFIHVVNELPSRYQDSTMSLTQENLDNTIAYLETQIPDESQFTGASSGVAQYPRVAEATTASYIVASCIGVNRIYYGAPGTGKSYAIDQETRGQSVARIVFHADTQFTDFVGCLKPVMDGESLTYGFRAGPFIATLINALKNFETHHWLVIEEINRAAAAAVFGEIFQLLDREADGSSKYGVTPSDPELVKFIEGELGKPLANGQIRIPSNLSILATMNSSDQAVMPMDTAFKRRWQFKYIPLDFTACADGAFTLHQGSGTFTVSWRDFALSVNKILSDLEIPEDRHLGPFFLSDFELRDSDSQNQALTGKLFMYLWDDVLRHGYRSEVFYSDLKTYGQLTKLHAENGQVFSDKFFDVLTSVMTKPVTPVETLATQD